MIILIDTSTSTCYLTLVSDQAQKTYEWEAGRTLARDLLGYLRDRLLEQGLSFHDISGIGIMKGPGSFTGLRIGMAVMNTLADGLDIPIVGEHGEYWQKQALNRLNRNENDQIVLPEYGTEAHITKPRK